MDSQLILDFVRGNEHEMLDQIFEAATNHGMLLSECAIKALEIIIQNSSPEHVISTVARVAVTAQWFEAKYELPRPE